MAGELQASWNQAGRTVYFQVRNRIAQIWNTSGGTGTFATYDSNFVTSYAISAAEQGNASAFYVGTMPSAVVAGSYSVVAKNQLGASPAETDPTVAEGNVEWNGSAIAPLADTATSGQLGGFMPMKLARSYQITNFPFYLRSAADHATPFTSGVCSGQISRDGGVFGALQSGAFSEVGNGFYKVQALTSGDLNAGTVSVLFTAVGVSGGSADPLPLSFILQRTSGNA